jgi:haloalkane dehalogenase
LIHGNPTWSFLWRHLIRELRDRYRMVAPDHIGCGLSDKPLHSTYSLAAHAANLVQLIDRLDLHQITLLVHDWGGPIGLRAAVARPHRLSRLILFNTGAFPPPMIPWRIRACRLPVLGRGAVQGLNLFALAAQRMAVSNPNCISAEARAGLLAPYDCWAHRHAIYQFVKDIPTSRRHPTWQHLADLESQLPTLAKLPVQMIWGMRDWCFRPLCLDRLMQHLPHAEVHRLEDVGHWVTEEAPERVGRLVQSFLLRTARL